MSEVVLISTLLVNMIAVLGVAFYGGRVLGDLARTVASMKENEGRMQHTVQALDQSVQTLNMTVVSLGERVDFLMRKDGLT